ncbi:MAG: 3-mercaptopyruvate sulfurtransferase [Methyloligellaceae bacterium]
MTSSKWLVETDWLAEHLEAPDVVILDASWHLPTENREAHAEFLEAHIPGALYFDIDRISESSSDLPHMLPSPIQFSSQMRKMGIGDGMRLVVYDTPGMFSAARVWWMFRTMGHSNVQVLNGGFKKWTTEQRPVEQGEPIARGERHFTARLDRGLVRDLDDMKITVAENSAQILDARAPERFLGEEPEFRPGLRSGHIPGSKNFHYRLLINDDGTMKSAREIESLFQDSEISVEDPIITTCGSGVTASVLALALALVGKQSAVYDGSWSEWGGIKELPIETDP